jgi:hypothetical protein
MRRRLAALGVALAIVALASGVVLAASKTIPNAGVFYACYDSGGNVRLIDYSVTQKCPKSWNGPVSWNQSGSIGIEYVLLDPTVDYRESPTVLSIFVETGSDNAECLTTLNEMWWDDGVPRATLENVFCASRRPIFDGVTLHGVWLHVFFSDAVGDNLNLAISVYQEGARFYAPLRFCANENACEEAYLPKK